MGLLGKFHEVAKRGYAESRKHITKENATRAYGSAKKAGGFALREFESFDTSMERSFGQRSPRRSQEVSDLAYGGRTGGLVSRMGEASVGKPVSRYALPHPQFGYGRESVSRSLHELPGHRKVEKRHIKKKSSGTIIVKVIR